VRLGGARQGWGAAAALAVCAMFCFAGSAEALAAPAAVTIDSRTPVLEAGEDGASKVSLTFLNLTDGEVELTAKPQRASCVLSLDKTRLEPATSTGVVVSIPSACKASEGLAIDVTATAGSAQLASFEVVPEIKPTTDPKWKNLWAFAIAFVVTLALLGLLFWKGWTLPDGAKRSLKQQLFLDATWSFNDNWATNVTAVGAILTGLFGASTATAFLGPEAESAVALATVGAAVALALVAAGPVVLLATKVYKVKVGVDKNGEAETEPVDSFSVGGMLLAAAVIFASAFGQLWVVMATGEELELGGLQDYLWIPFALAVGLLVVYGWRSLRNLLETNTAKPEEQDPDEIKAAKLIAAAIETKARPPEGVAKQGDAVRTPVEAVEAQLAAQAEAAGDSYQRRRRSALP
jgi:hypothetical protein